MTKDKITELRERLDEGVEELNRGELGAVLEDVIVVLDALLEDAYSQEQARQRAAAILDPGGCV